jgi:hypothetical protein
MHTNPEEVGVGGEEGSSIFAEISGGREGGVNAFFLKKMTFTNI